MSARGFVTTFDKLETGNAGFRLGLELAAVEQLAFKRRVLNSSYIFLGDRTGAMPPSQVVLYYKTQLALMAFGFSMTPFGQDVLAA